MGFFPDVTPEQWAEIKQKVARDTAAEKEATDRAGYKPLTGWFQAVMEEFRTAHGFLPAYIRDGKIYGWLQVRFELGLDTEKNPYVNYDAPPGDAAHWLERKEWWKKKLNIDYDTNSPR